MRIITSPAGALPRVAVVASGHAYTMSATRGARPAHLPREIPRPRGSPWRVLHVNLYGIGGLETRVGKAVHLSGSKKGATRFFRNHPYGGGQAASQSSQPTQIRVRGVEWHTSRRGGASRSLYCTDVRGMTVPRSRRDRHSLRTTTASLTAAATTIRTITRSRHSILQPLWKPLSSPR